MAYIQWGICLLKVRFHLPNSHLFRYLQERDFYKKRYQDFPHTPADTPIDTIFKASMAMKGLISTLYDATLSLCSPSDQTLVTIWSQDLKVDLSHLWESILLRVHSSSVCARHGVIQCKLLHCVYWNNKSRLSRIYCNIDPLCDKCRQHRGTLIHMFWTCPSLHAYWVSIFSTLSDVFQNTQEPCSLMALFGVLSDSNKLSKPQSDFVAFLCLIAWRLILRHWKSQHRPSHSLWIRDIFMFSKHLKRGSVSKCNKMWQLFILHVEGLDLQPLDT